MPSTCSHSCFSPSDETFDLGVRFELMMEVRPRAASGVLLYISSGEGFFTLYTHLGDVSLLRPGYIASSSARATWIKRMCL